MSNYTDFENAFLVAAYQFTEEAGEEYIVSSDIVLRGALSPKANWIGRAISGFSDSGYARNVHFNGNDDDVSFELTASGVRQAEKLLNGLAASEVQSDDVAVKSASWTGVPSTLSWKQREQLLTLLKEVEEEIDGLPLSNSARTQIRSYVSAARELAEAPEPQVDLIWEILNRANAMAGIASLFVSVISLFTAAAQ
ncbi:MULTISPECIES: hypothetical protein [Sphingomonas]|uniref:hypothetical protein n=1 Tax=Sphingomonas TaxID=13687 RepID=UPI000F7F8B0A|nr:hypothetical protein [Sphingomonas sp. ABOLF]RSV16318.1 hypothetical protein CA235_05460 [Sphingomonas sp. ABOLF]GLK21410.1 hypothetical protein GCM10017606_22360 [Microbacterium terregens]